METPKIYVGTYAKYNSGSIAGEWIDLTNYSDISEFYEACKELHADESDPEYMFQDYENIPSGLIGESWLSEKIFEYFEAMNQLDNPDAFRVYCENFSYDLDKEDISDLVEKFEDAFQYEMSDSDFTYEIVEQTMDIPEDIQQYFDYDKFERDLFISDYWSNEGYIFRNN